MVGCLFLDDNIINYLLCILYGLSTLSSYMNQVSMVVCSLDNISRLYQVVLSNLEAGVFISGLVINNQHLLRTNLNLSSLSIYIMFSDNNASIIYYNMHTFSVHA